MSEPEYQPKVTAKLAGTGEKLMSKRITEKGVDYVQYKWKTSVVVVSEIEQVAHVEYVEINNVKEYDIIEMFRIINRVYGDKGFEVRYEETTPYIQSIIKKATL